MKKYIIWLHIAVHDIVLIKYLKSLQKLFEDEKSVGL